MFRWKKIERNYRDILGKGDRFLSILNVGSIREVILQTEAVASLTWDLAQFSSEAFLRTWCVREFGPAAADEAMRLYRALFAAYVPLRSSSGDLLLDGVARFAGKDLLAPVLDRDTYPAYLAGNPGIERILDRYQSIAELSAKNFRKVADEGALLLPSIEEPRRPFFTDNLLVQAETMAGLSLWLEKLCLGLRAFSVLEVAEAASHAQDAERALAQVLTYRKRAEWGPWENWYRGDWRMNLPALHEDTARLAAKWTEFAKQEQR